MPEARSSSPDTERRPVVVVLGFHRSGTSMVTRMLNLLGVDLGDEAELLEAVELDNPRGYWEPRWMIDLNDELLAALGTSAFEPFRAAPGWERSPALEPLRERARELLGRHLAGRSRWGWKDPRTSLTLPFWRELIDAPLACIVCVRSPVETVASALRRGLAGIDHARYAEAWLEHTAAALANTAPEERMLVFYDDVLRDPSEEMRRVAAFVGVAPSEEQLGGIAASAAPDLRHHTSSAFEVADDQSLPVEARALYLLLRSRRDLEQNGTAPPDLLAALERLAPALEAAQRDRTAAEAGAARRDDLDRRLREREAELAERSAQLAACSAQLTERDALLAERDRAIATLLGSRSWRLTRPLRELGARTRRGG